MRKIIRGTKRELQRYLKKQNLPNRWLRHDEEGYYVKLSDKGNCKR